MYPKYERNRSTIVLRRSVLRNYVFTPPGVVCVNYKIFNAQTIFLIPVGTYIQNFRVDIASRFRFIKCHFYVHAPSGKNLCVTHFSYPLLPGSCAYLTAFQNSSGSAGRFGNASNTNRQGDRHAPRRLCKQEVHAHPIVLFIFLVGIRNPSMKFFGVILWPGERNYDFHFSRS